MKSAQKAVSMLVLGVLVLLSTFVLSGCGSGDSNATTQAAATGPLNAASQTASASHPAATTPVSQTSTESGYVTVSSADGNITISVPAGWNTNNTQLYPGAAIGVSDTANSDYLIVTEKPKSSMAQGATIETYLPLVKSAFGQVVTSPEWGKPSDITIGGEKGIALELTGTRKSSGTNTVYYINIVESKNYFYNVCGYTLVDSAKANKPILEKIINSFKEKD